MASYLLPFVAFALLAICHQIDLIRTDRFLYAAGLFGIGVFAGLRFETGQDWPAYEAFFQNLDLSSNIRDLYFSEEIPPPPFEIGYYSLNYLVKYLGGNYTAILLLSSLFCAYAVFRFTAKFNVNHFYILSIYVSYSFLILHFAQVRQAIAIGFFLLGCDCYLRHGKKFLALAVSALGVLFQFSSLMYIALLPLVFWWPKKNRAVWMMTFWVAAVPTVIVLTYSVDFYSLLTFLAANASAEEKIAIYKETQADQGAGQRIYAVYLLALACYFYRYASLVEQRHSFVVKYAIAVLLLTVLLAIIFPGSYVMYSRAYVAACIFQACAGALVFASARHSRLHATVFAVTLLVAGLSYWRLVSLYEDEYVPYRNLVTSSIH